MSVPDRPSGSFRPFRPFRRSSPACSRPARLLLRCCLLLLCPLPSLAADPSPAQLQFFENKIRPIFVNNCYKCHSRQAEKLKAGLSLESRESILKGGDSGPAIVPGDPNRSLLIKAVRYTDPDLQMPPKDQPLSSQQVADLETWVKIGAPFPRAAASTLAADWAKNRREHWSFQPLKPVAIPEVADSNWVSTPVDAFILAKLEASQMKPAPPADKRALLRRATFDLTGLPPTPDEARAFEDDPSPDAFAKVVDRLLASPQYGERWGRFWLDTARYADTKGDIKQNQDVPQYAFAWVYRDYVVRAFNEDKPYNRFLLEQIAGDQLTPTKDRQELAAMGFLTLGPRFNDNNNDIINDRIDVVCKGTMGLTVTCARCHDHKFDPIPQTDYYSLKGIFDSSAEPAEQPLMGEIQFTPAYTNFAAKLSATNQILADAQLKLRSLPRGGGADTNTANQRRILQQQVNQARRAAALLEANDPGSPPRATILRDIVKPHDDPLLIRGEAANKGELGAAPFPHRHFRPHSPALPRRQRPPPTGRVHHQSQKSPHRPRPGQPRLDAPFRRRLRHHPGRFRQPIRPAQPSRIARLSGRALHAGRLVHQETPPPHHAFQRLSGKQREQSPLRRNGPAEPPPLARQHPPPRI